MSREPYRSASNVFWVVDNGTSHRGDRCQQRLARQWPNLIDDAARGGIHGLGFQAQHVAAAKGA